MIVTRSRLAIAFLAALLLTSWIGIVVASGAGWNPIAVRWNFTNAGAFGDSFGPLSAAMGCAAAIGAFLAWNEQRKEISRQKDNDRSSKLELQISRDDQTFFNYIRLFQDIVASTDIQRSTGPDKRGQDAYGYILGVIFRTNRANLKFASEHVFSRYVNDLGHYFRTLYNIIAFIDRSSLPDKYLYVKIVRSLLSEAELNLIGLNCLYGGGHEKFKPLVEKYALLKNLSNESIDALGLREEFKRGAFVKLV